ncbi:FecR domain-containing protein [Leptospira sp. 96542]|nr:FecR domain-containing protein [Leptospira sp. 96542]
MNLDLRDKYVLIGLLSIALAFSILFYLDLNRKIDIGDREVVGTIHFKNNIVQRKLEDQVIWEKLENNSPLIKKDTIRSEAFSDAIIRLKDGTEINIDENSMFNLDLTGDEPSLEFTEGSLQVKKGDSKDKNIKITSAGSEINVNSGDVKIEKDKSNELNLFVEKGNTTVKQNGKEVKVEGGNKAELRTTGIEVKQIPVQLLLPSSQKLFLTESKEVNIQFSWKMEDGFKDPMIEISRSPSFQLSLIKEKVTGTLANFKLREGTYYWRIHVKNAKSGKKDTSDTGKFFVTKDEPLKTQTPDINSEISYVSSLPLISLTWNQIATAKGYRVEVSESPKFSNLLKNLSVDSTQVSFDDISEGNYYWRVFAVSAFADTKDKESNTSSFKVIKQANYQTPTWIRPTNGSEVTLEEIQRGQAILIWEASSELTKFKVQIAKDGKFQNTLQSEEVTTNFFIPNWNKFGIGTLYARISGKSNEGKETEWSQVLKFSIAEKKQIIEVEKEDNEPKLEILSPSGTVVQMKGKSSLDFNWKSSSGFDKFELVLYQYNGDRKTAIYRTITKDTKHSLKDLSILDEGSFSWELSGYKPGNITLSRKGNFILALDQFKTLKPTDIQFISPKRLYKGKKSQ